MRNSNLVRRGSVLERRRRVRRTSFMVLAASAACVQWMQPVRGATDSWTGTAATGNWATASNWSAGVPVAGNAVDITDDDDTSRDITYNYTGSAITLGTLIVDNDGAEGINTLSMTGSGTALTASNEYFGDSNTSTLPGYGVMIQSVGTNSLASSSSLVLGDGADDQGTYSLSGNGTLIAATESIGLNGAGTFTQSGGNNTITNSGEITLGTNTGSNGSYILSAGTVDCQGSEIVGNNGAGAFSQSGGNNSCELYVGFFANGNYSLGGSGVVNGGSEIIGYDSTGTFIQSSGTNNANGYGQPGALLLGYLSGSSGYYSLSAGTLLLSNGPAYIGYDDGSGTFVQSGGTASVSGDVYVGDSSGVGTGTMSVSGGLLSISGDLVAANSTVQTISLSGGTISLGGLNLSGNPSLLDWTGGTLNFVDGVTIDKSFALGATLTLTSGLTLSSDGTLNDNGEITMSAGAGLSAPLLNIGDILNYSGGTISASVVTVGEGASFNVNSALTNLTSIDVATGGGVQVNGVSLTNNGVIQVQTGGLISGTGTITNSVSGMITGSGSIGTSITNNGIIQPMGGLMSFAGALTNPGTISAPVGGEALLEDMPVNAGTLSLNGGTISTGGATLHNTNTGQILGYGILTTGGLNNDGTVAFAGQSSVYGPVTNRSDGLIHLSGNTLNVFYGAVTNNGQFTVDAGASGSIDGAYTGSGPILDNGSLYLNANSVAGPISGTGFLTIGSTSSGPAIVQLNASSGLSVQDALSINTGSTLDITNNHFIISYGSSPDPVATIRSYLISGYNGGAWDGTGIDSSSAAANPNYGVGYADSADPGNPAGLSSDQIEIKYTLYGDANLDGKVNSVDLGILAANFGGSGKVWDEGNFNYDPSGKVNSVDLGLLAENFGESASGADVALPASDWAALDAFAAANGVTIADVPEPASAGVAALSAIALLPRRRRPRC